MMTSELLSIPPKQAFVWIWLPGADEPTVCGRLDAGAPVTFTYARSYRERSDAVPIFEPELPLSGQPPMAPLAGLGLPLCIDDAMPDTWGRRLVNHRLGAWTYDLPPLTYLLASASDRTGALDFQRSSGEYVERGAATPTLDDLADASRRIEEGEPLPDALNDALLLGTSLGGARPKALLRDGGRELIAKFPSSADTYPVEQGEFVAMTLAARCGLDVAGVSLATAQNRPTLLVERFDRPGGSRRSRVVSALTVLGLTVHDAGRRASYSDLADQMRASFTRPDATLRELFGRIAFNMLCGNTDDHGKNHAALVDGRGLELAPAFDVCPQRRGTGPAEQAMPYGRDGQREARLSTLVDAAPIYHLDPSEAQAIVDEQIDVIRAAWDEVCDEAQLTSQERRAFLGHQFLHPDLFA